jgi:hypothetical protein
MKLHPEDPRLTAYLLGELSPDEAAAVEHAAGADAAVRSALDETYKLQRVLMSALAPASTALLPRQRETIRRALRESANAGETIPFPVRKKSLPSFIVPLGIAAAAVFVSWLALRKPTPDAAITPTAAADEPSSSLPYAVAILPARGPKPAGISSPLNSAATKTQLSIHARALDTVLKNASSETLDRVARQLADAPLPDNSTLPELLPRDSVSTAISCQLELPVLAGRGSLGWIYKSVRDQRVRPSANFVRLEEILNAFDLRPSGTAAITKGASLSAESLACPWKPSATLLMIHFQGASDGPREVSAVLDLDPTAVATYRLLGFSPVRGLENGDMPSRLPAKTGTTLLVEIEPRANASLLGNIHWKVQQTDAAPVQILRKPEVEPSNDARFATLLAAYSLWLTHDQPDQIDTDVVSGLARECAASDLPLDRSELLILIGKTIELTK